MRMSKKKRYQQQQQQQQQQQLERIPGIWHAGQNYSRSSARSSSAYALCIIYYLVARVTYVLLCFLIHVSDHLHPAQPVSVLMSHVLTETPPRTANKSYKSYVLLCC